MNATSILLIVFISFFSVVIHEIFHSLASYTLGDDTAKRLGRISLNPLKHIDPVMTIIFPIFMALSGGPVFGGAKPVPINFNRLKFGDLGMALVAIAGPAANLLLAFLFYGIFYVVPNNSEFISQVLVTAVHINLGFFVFNLLPVPPLDGSRVLYSVAPGVVRSVMEKIERYGMVVIFSLIVLFNNQFSSYISNVIGFLLNIFKVIIN